MMTLLLICALCGVLGYLIGNPKGRGVEGALWGAVLGLIGLLIIAIRKPASTSTDA